MKNKFIFTVIAIVFLVFTDLLFFKFRWFNSTSGYFDIIYLLIFSVTILIILLNLSYKKLFDFKKSIVGFVFFLFFFLIFSFFLSQRILVINKLYFFTKNYRHDEKGRLWQADDKLSYKGKPNFSGTQNYYIGDSIQGHIETYFDSLGFRSVSKNNMLRYDTLNLFLGCSFTFGSFITADETFAHKLSEKIENNYINAGGSGYGMGQMLILLDSLIEKYRFKYVFIQLSPWLVERAMQINAPFYYFYRPIPYFSETGNTFKLNYIAYKNTSLAFKRNWNLKTPDYFEKFIFFFVDGIKIEINDYLKQKIAKIKISLGILPAPAKNKNELEKFAYTYAIEKCKTKGVTPILLKIGYSEEKPTELLYFLKNKCMIIDLDEALNDEVKRTGKSYYELYSISHKHQGQNIIFDTHPNSYANELIANKIYETLKNN
jgi:hypothetical protein